MNPEPGETGTTAPEPPPSPPWRPNSFQLLGAILAAAAGVRGISKRGRSFADASTGSIIGAVLIFAGVLYFGFRAFIHAIQG